MDALASAYMEFRHLTSLKKNDIKGIDNMSEWAIFNYILEREKLHFDEMMSASF
jgi:hypothetical protein